MNAVPSTMLSAVAGSTACPACHSSDIRPSQKAGRFESFHAWRNQQRYRCRECRHSFYAGLSANERAKIRASETIRKKRARGWSGFVQSGVQRRVIETLLFIGMLMVFYAVFNSLVSKDGTGIFSRANTEAQP
jgi:transposase-like protein